MFITRTLNFSLRSIMPLLNINLPFLPVMVARSLTNHSLPPFTVHHCPSLATTPAALLVGTAVVAEGRRR
ncbi:hypothetical protein LguiB_010719 [Lonicera macranthoides]